MNHSTKAVTTLSDVITSGGADELFGHASFTKGAPPASFMLKTEMLYHPVPLETILFQVCKASQKVSLTWAVTCGNGKITPKGIAIAPSGQITLKPGHDFSLTGAADE